MTPVRRGNRRVTRTIAVPRRRLRPSAGEDLAAVPNSRGGTVHLEEAASNRTKGFPPISLTFGPESIR